MRAVGETGNWRVRVIHHHGVVNRFEDKKQDKSTDHD
jgi:hypothetical protein